MKKVIFFIAITLCFVFTNEANAQRALQGMKGLQISGGMADGFHSSENINETGYYIGVAMTTYAKKANKWMFGAEYLYRNYPYKNSHIPVAQFTGEGGYFFNFLTDRSKTFFVSIGTSALAGYETVNWNEKLLYDGSTIQNKDAYIYGGAITLELETYLSDRIVLLINGRERILWGTTTGHFHTQFGIGLKFIIN